MTNPFSTRWVRPGALPFLFRGGESGERLLERLQANRWRGQIIGPHGSGKSTLLRNLLPLFGAAGRNVLLIELHNGERWLPLSSVQRRGLNQVSVVAVDGYEQLSRLARFNLQRLCRRRECGLLVTAHTTAGLPTLFTCQPDLELAQSVFQYLLSAHPSPLTNADLAACFADQAGNLRETLFDLYHRHEARLALPGAQASSR